MNLVDLLAPKMPHLKQGLAETAEVAENQQPQPITNPPPLAESGGKTEIRQNPPPLAENKTRLTTAFPPNPPNPPPVTREYFASQGVDLLPEDLAFLRWHLPKDNANRNKAIHEYMATWLEAAAREPSSQRKANRGRFAANTRLQK